MVAGKQNVGDWCKFPLKKTHHRHQNTTQLFGGPTHRQQYGSLIRTTATDQNPAVHLYWTLFESKRNNAGL